jgi:hypothetical protein
MPDPRKKIQHLISSLEELRLHVGRKDLAVGKQRVNALLFFSLANACLRGRCVLLYGGMGANKMKRRCCWAGRGSRSKLTSRLWTG